MSKDLILSEEIINALKNNLPIVALESTIITHGMEYPQNYETAIAVERVIRDNGAIPATIAIINGKIRIGFSEEEIKEIAMNKKSFCKCTTRDLPFAICQNKNGSTTVAATMYCANLAGIKIFATGGIGGVHFGEDWDVSADLTELGRTQVMVICAGAKSILDIGKTLEMLETLSVPVIGYNTDTFPEFYFSDGDNKISNNISSHKEIAHIFNKHIELKLPSGILVGVPVPKEFSADKELVKSRIKLALDKAQELKIKGPEITPFLLKEVNELTEGKSSLSNVALIKNNAKHAALIAIEFHKSISK
jgi:pseudouridine-5'-phosphate glycosidase